jgi:hypothetical protein
MPIDAISSATPPAGPPIRNDFQNLATALKNGNITAAQKAYAAIQDAQQNAPNGAPQPPANSPIAKDFAALGDALKNGDIDAAQQAFSALQNDAQAARAQHGGGHHGGGGKGGKDDDTGDSTDNAQKTIQSQVSTTASNGTVSVTITYTDGSTSTRTDPNPDPVTSQSPLSSNSNQLATLLSAQEQAALQNPQ